MLGDVSAYSQCCESDKGLVVDSREMRVRLDIRRYFFTERAVQLKRAAQGWSPHFLRRAGNNRTWHSVLWAG